MINNTIYIVRKDFVMSERVKGFPPIIFEDSEVLLLGTLPGDKSLQQNFYYADNKNYFWKFFNKYTGHQKPCNMDEVSKILKETKIALWDMYDSGIRQNKQGKKTSNDSDIRQAIWNDIPALLANYPNIKRVGIMGKDPYKEFQKSYPFINAVYLPSTSSSNGAKWGNPIEQSIGWKEFKDFIEQTSN